jgi:hypothetical protein
MPGCRRSSFLNLPLILSKDAPISGIARRPRSGDVRSSLGGLRSAPKNRPLRADVAQALLGGRGPGDGRKVLGHSPLNLLPEPGLNDVGRDVQILRHVSQWWIP